MLNVAVCDDNTVFLEEMRIALAKDVRVKEIEIYNSPEDFWEAVADQGKKFDGVFMDIEFGMEKTGINYAEELYPIAPTLGIVYVTGYNDRFAQHILLTDSNLIGYLTKPLDEELLGRYLDKLCNKQDGKSFLTFNIQGKTFVVATESILYVESHNHTVSIHTDRETYVSYEKLSELRARLPKEFIQCHKSFLVNMKYISSLEPDQVKVRETHLVPVSKTHMAETRAAFFRYIGQNL